MRILLVEDDAMISESICASLKDASYAVDSVDNGQIVETAVRSQNYDIVLLDLGLPGKDGLMVLKLLRQSHPHLPVIILTARDDIDSRLSGLDGGADDYMIKPFDMSELLARMRVALRRRSNQATSQLHNGPIVLDLSNYQVSIDGIEQSILLSNKEFSILQALILHPGQIYSRSELEDKVYGWGEEVESNAIDFLIHALRKKIGKEYIKNIRGVGWMVSNNGSILANEQDTKD